MKRYKPFKFSESTLVLWEKYKLGFIDKNNNPIYTDSQVTTGRNIYQIYPDSKFQGYKAITIDGHGPRDTMIASNLFKLFGDDIEVLSKKVKLNKDTIEYINNVSQSK
jgi:hypothetical protein